jgi:hypothetical protein
MFVPLHLGTWRVYRVNHWRRWTEFLALVCRYSFVFIAQFLDLVVWVISAGDIALSVFLWFSRAMPSSKYAFTRRGLAWMRLRGDEQRNQLTYWAHWSCIPVEFSSLPWSHIECSCLQADNRIWELLSEKCTMTRKQSCVWILVVLFPAFCIVGIIHWC